MAQQHDPGTNYHNSLVRLQENFDPVMNKIRNNYEVTKNNGWFFPCLAKVLPDIKGMWTSVRSLDLGTFLGKAIGAAPFLAASLSPLLSTWIGFSWVYGAGFGLILFAGMFLKKLWIMTIPAPDNDDFHLAAYRFLRKKEYSLFSGAFLFQDFTFAGLCTYVAPMLHGQGNLSEVVGQVRHDYQIHTQLFKERFEKEVRDLEQVVSYLSEQISKQEQAQEIVMAQAEQTIAGLRDKWMKASRALELSVQLLDLLTTRAFRLHNGVLKEADLQLIAPFTLYRLNGDLLEKIGDVGTTGKSETKVPIKAARYQNWATVQVLTETSGKPKYNEPRENYVIVSYRLNMRGEVWVYNLHIDTTSNKNALDMTIHGIMDPTKFQRVIHVLCLLLQERGYPNQEEVRHA